jgi:hypothetical protein
MHALRSIFGLLDVALLLACGAGASSNEPAAQPPAPSDPSSGDEPTAASAERAPGAVADDPAPLRAGPATVEVNATVRGQSVAAEVRMVGADGSEAGTGRSGEPISVQSGEYTLLVTIADEDALLDKPQRRQPLTIHPGDGLKETVEFPWAMIQLNVRVNGRPDNGAIVELKRQGAVVGKLKSGAEPVPISPGRYDAEVRTRGATIPVQGLMFPEGATQSMPVDVRL